MRTDYAARRRCPGGHSYFTIVRVRERRPPERVLRESAAAAVVFRRARFEVDRALTVARRVPREVRRVPLRALLRALVRDDSPRCPRLRDLAVSREMSLLKLLRSPRAVVS